MGAWVKVAREGELLSSLGVTVGKKRYALFRLADGIYALDDICSHEYALLSEGEVWEEEVYCPRHGSRFDIRSGAVRNFPATRPVHSYPVKVEEGNIFIRV